MVNFDTQYTNINYLNNNNTSNKKAVVKNDDDAYYESIIKKFGDLDELREKSGYNGSPDVKEVENSLYKRYMEDKLSKDEIEMLNEVSGIDFLVKGDLVELNRRHTDLLKTLTSMSEFVKIWGAEREERRKQFIAALDVKPLTQEDIDRFLTNKNDQKEDKEKPFKPIQGESQNKETYKDEIKNDFWQQFLKIQEENGMNILELFRKLNDKGINIKV